MAIVWDEGYTLGREARIRAWLRALASPRQFAQAWQPPGRLEEMVPGPRTPPPALQQLASRRRLLVDPGVVEWFWPFAREEPHGHPPFYALVGLTGDLLAPWLKDLARARLGPILLFSFTAGVVFQFVALRWGFWAASLAAGAWVFQPNLFGHGHYAAYDGVLASLWILAIATFSRAVDLRQDEHARPNRWCWTIAFGVILGCAAATKLTGWFLPLPFLAWMALYRSRSTLNTMVVALLVGACTLYLLVPPWWTQPIAGVVGFIESNRTRSDTIPIQIQFLGSVYNTPTDSLPWYNTLAWTVLVTPVGFLLMAGAGAWSALCSWRSDRIAVLCLVQWAFLMILRALPHIPGHDGVRLFLPAFGVLALLAGIGARAVSNFLPRWSKTLVAVAVLEGGISVAVMMPVPLSYFSPVVGGLPGAAALGMEPTYYWDALAPEARQWLKTNTPPGQTILFRTFPLSWLYLRKIGELPPRLAPIDDGQTRWVVLQNRPGSFSEVDRALIRRNRPAYVIRKLGVPLVWIFPYSELRGLGAPKM
jgi:4-amino-4-deoxy-L-arabinose transferase-like glycosyltransferase